MSRKSEYLLLKFYIPDYNFQSRPISIRTNEIKARGDEGVAWAIRYARDIFLRSLRHKGQGIHPSHLKLAKDGKVTYTARLRELDSDQLSALGSITHITSRHVPEKVGWEIKGNDRRRMWLRRAM